MKFHAINSCNEIYEKFVIKYVKKLGKKLVKNYRKIKRKF